MMAKVDESPRKNTVKGRAGVDVGVEFKLRSQPRMGVGEGLGGRGREGEIEGAPL